MIREVYRHRCVHFLLHFADLVRAPKEDCWFAGERSIQSPRGRLLMALLLHENQRQARFCVALFEPTKLILYLQKFCDYFLLEERHIGILLLSALKIANPRFLFFFFTAQSLACCLRNSETLRPARLAFSSSLEYSACVIRSLTILDLCSDLGFGGRPMRFLILCLHDSFWNTKSQVLSGKRFGRRINQANGHSWSGSRRAFSPDGLAVK